MARKLKPEDKHVTRKELLAELVIIARAADASIAQLREEFMERLPLAGVQVSPPARAVVIPGTPESIPSPAEGPE